MKSVFADTFYYLALVSEDDTAHQEAAQLSLTLRCPIVTTTWVLTEVGDAFAHPQQRIVFVNLLERLSRDDDLTVIEPSQSLFDSGVDLYAQRPDKEWSLTDCISFVVMQDHNISEALTGDHHFEQAGFVALLK